MNEQLYDKLIEILTSIQNATKAAGDFALEQLPDVAMQYVMYGRVRTLVVTLFLLGVSSVCFATFRWVYKNPWYGPYDGLRSEENKVIMGLTLTCGIVTLFASVFSFDWLVWVAPKVWLIKELAALVR